MTNVTSEQAIESLHRLFKLANDFSGTARKIRGFLLSCWNAGHYGGFDVTDCWSMDEQNRNDVITVFTYLAHNNVYFDSLGFREQIEKIAKRHNEIKEVV